MLTINRMTDYATLLMTRFADQPERVFTATEIANGIPLTATTIRKLLRMLAHHGVLISQKGRKGGFRLARPASEISLAQVMEAMEDPLALTYCGQHKAVCSLEHVCQMRPHWHKIGEQIHTLLANTSLSQLVSGRKEHVS
ncbi:MAG: SUF system Fe-S cluster assembly regulator [Magnetococcales bacterium]|nr:SUF system Fe-S cluster assembly regulator [Magnetococcales bacterium]